MKNCGESPGAMSRRKQLKPRALKREQDGEEEEMIVAATTSVMETELNNQAEEEEGGATPPDEAVAAAATSVVSMDTHETEDEAVPGDVTMVTRDEEGVGREEYRCEMCDTVFQSLTQFMDHRNYDCTAVLGVPQWSFTQSVSPSSSVARSELSPGPVSPSSPILETLALDQIPYVNGITEEYVHGCQVCDKAFTRRSHLHRHEQVHTEELPYQCDHCRRVFRHRRTRDHHSAQHVLQYKHHCTQCTASFSGRDHLKLHLKTHGGGKQFPCPDCPETFSFISSLTSHMMRHKAAATGVIPGLDTASLDTPSLAEMAELSELACPQCAEKCYSMEELQVHLQGHSEELAMEQDKTVMSCPYCAEMFVEHEVMELHIEQAHTVESVNKCHICSMCFLDHDDLTLHLKSHETTALLNDAKMKRKSRVSEKQAIGDDPTRLDCPYCVRKGFSTLGMLNVHIRTMHTGIADHLFSCQICNVGFASSNKLSEHIEKEHPRFIQQEELEIKFPCDYCTLEFNGSEILRKHKEKVHKITDSVPKPVDVVYCSQCTMGFPHIYALAEHMHNVHGYNNNNRSPSGTPTKSQSPDEKPLADMLRSPSRDTKGFSPAAATQVGLQDESYLCDHCNSTFHSLGSYQVHIKNHVDVSKYACTECQAEFTSEEQLESHMFVHYLVLATQYGCTSCLKLFIKPDELQKHLMDIHAHHLYRCSLCKEVFDSKVNIQVHFAIKHSNECKLYKCSSCGSVFRSEMEWQLHVKIYHLGISKPYRCFFCRDSFTSETDLQAHTTTTHKKQSACPLCDEAFHVEYLLDKHMQSAHCPDGVKVNQPKIKTEPPMSDVDGIHFSAPPPPGTSRGSGSTAATKTTSGQKPSSRAMTVTAPMPCGDLIPPLKNGDLNYKCEICDVKFSDEGTLQKHRVHDHSMSPEMQLVMQKNEQAKATQRALLNVSPKGGHTSGEKFSQLCVYCNQTFKTKGELEKHMKTHVTPSNQKCNICDEVFPSASILAEHKLTHCKVVKGNVCVVCKVAMKSEEQFYNHSQQHGFQGTNMQCVVCRQTLASMLELQMHARHHFQNPANFYTCCVCVKSFNSKENLIAKLNTSGRTYYVCKPCYHGDMPAGATLEHHCPQCNIKFENKVQTELHMLQHQKTFQCIKCQQSFSTEYEIQLHVASHVMQEGNVHECKICNQIFESPAKLQCHLIDHTFEKTDIKCYICGLVFTQASAIQMHVLDHGVGARQYGCKQCPQKFFFNAELQNHTYCHGPQPGLALPLPTSPDYQPGLALPLPTSPDYQCQECGKVYGSLTQLKAHHKVHKNDSSLHCSLCMEPFSTMIELQQHFFLAHSGLDFDKPMGSIPGLSPTATAAKKPVQCVECGKEFPSVNSLQGHMRVHSSSYKARNNGNTNSGNTNSNSNSSSLANTSISTSPTKHGCPDCGKELSSAKNLAFHMRVHTGEKPYECPVCHKRFSRKENRRSHMKTHTGVKPYVCPICSRNFSRRCHVKEHIKVHFTQPCTQTCEVCGETFNQMRHMRRHLVLVHNQTPTYVCKLCSEHFESSKQLRAHAYQTHNLQDDLIETLSISSDDQNRDVTDFDGEDTSDSLSYNSDTTFHNGRENVDPTDTHVPIMNFHNGRENVDPTDTHVPIMNFHNGRENVAPTDPHITVNGLDILPKLEGNITMVTTPPEQLTVN